MGRNRETLLRKFHQARWDEPIIFELSVPGARGVLVPEVEDGIIAAVGDPAASVNCIRLLAPR